MEYLYKGQHFDLISSCLKGIKETALHLAVRLEERSSLALVDFLCQNRSDSDTRNAFATTEQYFYILTTIPSIATVWRREHQKETRLSTTAFCITSLNHSSYCSKQRQPFTQVHLNLLLIFLFHLMRKTTTLILSLLVNSGGETALDIARRLQHTQCVELVRPQTVNSNKHVRCAFKFNWGVKLQYWNTQLQKQNSTTSTAGNTTLKKLPLQQSSAKDSIPRMRNPILIRSLCVSFINCFYFLTGHLPCWIRAVCNIRSEHPCSTGLLFWIWKTIIAWIQVTDPL